MGRSPLVVALITLVAGCQLSSNPAPVPSPTPPPHTAAAVAVLQQPDVASGLQVCAGSGPMAGYFAAVKGSNPTLAGKVSDQWKALQKVGAFEGAISLYAADLSACSAELAASGTVRAEASLVVVFTDQGEADRAWQTGIFGLAPPAPGESPPGVSRGKSTGLGDEAWTYTNAPIQLACWRKGIFVAVVAVSNLDGATFKGATAAVDARLS